VLKRLLLGFCLSLCLPLCAQAAGVAVGQVAPPVVLPQLAGAGDISLESLRGKVVYLDFWASWCGPCRISFPILNQLRKELGPKGFEVLAVNVDEVESDANNFLSEVPVDFLIVRDPTATTPQTFGILGMPTGYLIDKQGTVREIHQGFRKNDGDKLRTAIMVLLGE
jgi:thiol-disulfide isomerase/thioredoxin